MSELFTLRPAVPGDEARLHAFFHALSPEAVSQFTPHSLSPAGLEKACREPHHLLALTPEGKPAGYAVIDTQRAVPFVSLAVAEPCQGHGSVLIRQVQDYARDAGMTVLAASVDRMNLRAQKVARYAGFSPVAFAPDHKQLLVCGLRPEYAQTQRLPALSRTLTDYSGEPVTIRSLRPDDGEALYRFFEDMDEIGKAYYTPHARTRDALETLCRGVEEAQDADRFVAEAIHDGAPCIGGYVFLSLLQGVMPSMGIGAAAWMQGRGVGRMMLDFIQDRARAYDRRCMRLITHETNFRAQKLYKTGGFEVMGTSPHGELLMFCDLTALPGHFSQERNSSI